MSAAPIMPVATDVDLQFARTVDRTTVHRDALSEVFLTDCRAIGPHSYLAAAQLPSSHAYYGDHRSDESVLDALLLLECCRQAETCGGHDVLGIETGTRFVLLDWSLNLTQPGVPAGRRRPVELTMATTCEAIRRRGPVVQGLTYRFTLAIEGRAVGNAHIRVGYLRAEAYDIIRRRRRSGPPPVSTTFDPGHEGEPVAAHRVGRHNQDNVVLLDPARTPDGRVTARVRTAVGHPSMFDHAQDHLPGMVLMEAGRQAAVLATGAGDHRGGGAVTQLYGTFAEYAELDSPVYVEALPLQRSGPGWALALQYRQSDRIIASGGITVRSAHGAG